jgi:acetate kinase
VKVLVINAGSSSLKYQLIDMDTQTVMAKGLCERIGIDGKLKHETDKTEIKLDIPMKDHKDAIKVVLDSLTHKDYAVIASMNDIDAVGHRFVHGAEFFKESCLIDDEMMKVGEACVEIAPLHNPPNIVGINACKAVLGDIPQVAVFDTAFHSTLPKHAYLYAIPYKYFEDYKIRKYGFHGTSHRYVTQRVGVMLNKSVKELKIITCHLGNGSSVAAVKNGKSIDTTMGFTPLEGLIMGTRSGSIDPAILPFIMEKEGIDAKAMSDILNKKSGVLGLSGVSADFRDVEKAAAEGNERAQVTIDQFCYQVKKYIGAYAAAMGGVDAVVFTAGVGENSVAFRKQIVEGLEFLGIAIDDAKNIVRGKEVDISAVGAKVRTLVIPTNEELMIAMDTKDVLSNKK